MAAAQSLPKEIFKAYDIRGLDGKTMSKDSLNEPGQPSRMAQSIKRLHAGPRFYSDFNMFRLTAILQGIGGGHE